MNKNKSDWEQEKEDKKSNAKAQPSDAKYANKTFGIFAN